MNLSFFFKICFLLSFLSCQINGQQNPPEKSANELPNQRALVEEMWSSETVMLVYPADNQETAEEWKTMVKKLEGEYGYNKVKIKSLPANELSAQDFVEKMVILLGTATSNPWIAKVQEKLPFLINENHLLFDEKKFLDATTVLRLPFYPNPLNPQMPMQVITGLNNTAVLTYLKDFIEKEEYLLNWSSWGYEIFQNQQRIINGNFHAETWAFDKKVHFDFSMQPDSMPSTKHFEFIKRTELNEAQAGIVRKKCEENVAEIRAFLNTKKEIPTIKYCLYRSAEEKGLIIGNTDQSDVHFKSNSVHTVLNETYSDNFIGKENELLLRQFLGEPKTLALERGLAICFTKKWQRKGYQYWAKKLYDSGNILPLADILNEEKGSTSRYLNGCLSASFVEFLLENSTKEVFLTQYLNRTFGAQEIVKLEEGWQQWLASKTIDVLTKKRPEMPYLKGFNFAHEGYRIYNGYISREATKSLEKQVDLGANATALVPYTFMRDPRKPTTISIANSAGGENDESIVHSARMAQNRGMTVMLKPQIWVGGGSWPGEVDMDSEADWQLWFDNYYQWILHYAMMAEIHEMEVLCVGTEFVKATLNRPDDWRKMLKKIRGLYSGKLTYASNWGDEFEKLTFWDEFDYIGLNCYYPLSKNNKASDKELKAGFQEAIKKIEAVYKREKKPIIFTEIGFRSIEMPWLNPHAEPDHSFNEEHQKRCYEIVFESIHKQPWCQGILWWKFPSYLGHRGLENTSFSPNNKVTEAVIRKWFLEK